MEDGATPLRFDGWTVDRLSGELSRAGRSARLPQQPLRILIELFDHAGGVVTREHLVKALWPQGVVDFDNGLNVAVRKLRVALDDVGDAPRYIETLPRVGYRFIGKPEAVASASPAADSPPARPALARLVLAAGFAIALAPALGLSWWWWSGRGHERHTPSERAQELYLEALQYRARRDIDTLPPVMDRLSQALREDPDFPQAWAAYGAALSAMVLVQKIPPAEGIPKARAAAARALSLDPDLSEGYALLGQLDMDFAKDFGAAKRDLDRATQLDDHNSRLWHSIAMWHGQLGHIDAAFVAIRRARELEPNRLLFLGNYGLLLYESRRYQQAIEFLRPVIEANPKFDQGHSVLARALMATGNLADARTELMARTANSTYQAELGVLDARLGQREAALQEIARLQEKAARGFGTAYDQALIHAALGDTDAGCAALARAVTDYSLLVNWMRLEPGLDPLRGRQCYIDAERKLYATAP
jgi:DNA-binding winged helix-turn-helix (wHTH) protein/Tfp pilus assembly protein PilF